MIDADLYKLLETIQIMEAATFRAQAMAIVAQATQYIQQAVAVLQNSRFSPSARLNFRARISGALRRNASTILDLGWQAGGGDPGKAPPELLSEYMDNQQAHLSAWFLQIKSTQKIPGGELRAQMYAESLMGLYRQGWEAAQRASTGVPALPAEPRDGSTLCLMFCLCHWEIRKISPDEYHAFWRKTDAENCLTCLCRAEFWNPLKITRVSPTTPGAESGWLMTPSGTPTCALFK